MTLVTVITPSYNQGQYLEDTIRSVISQEGDFSLDYIITDGGSTDNSVEIIKKYESLLQRGEWPIRCRGIKYRWLSEKDKGQTDAIMKGFRMAEGEIFSWLNSDDTYLSGALRKAVDVLAGQPEVSVLYGRSYYTNDEGAIIGKYPNEPFDFKRLAISNFICQPSTFFRKKAFFEVGGLDMDLHYVMDYDLWIRLAGKFEFKYLPEFLSTYRLHGESKTVSPKHALESQRECLEIVMKHYHWATANRVYGYCFYKVKNTLPSILSKIHLVNVMLAVPFSLIKYLVLNRGIHREDLRTITIRNIKKFLWEPRDVHEED